MPEWNPGDVIEHSENRVKIEKVNLSSVRGEHIELKVRVPHNEDSLAVLGAIFFNGGYCGMQVTHTVPEPERSPKEIAEQQNGKLEFDEDEGNMEDPGEII